MPFLTPAAFAALSLAIPILLLYMLRLRRREVEISSTFLWRQVLEDTEANTPWQRLRRNLLLFLQLLILLALVLALARPFITVPTVSAGVIALLVDASASMQADDLEGRTRFDAAMDRARDMVDNMNPNDEISLIRVANVAEPLTGYTGDKGVLRRAIDAMTPSQGDADWDTALTLAAAGAARGASFSIVMISDGGTGSIGALPANIPKPIYIAVGESANNVAITALATRALPGEAPRLFAQVTNYGAETADISLVARLDGVLRFSRSGSIPPRTQLPIPFDEPIDMDFETLAATLTFDNDVADHLALDNDAYAVRDVGMTRRIYFVSAEGNLFLEQALRSLPGAQTFRASPENRSLPAADFDLYVFDGWLPNTLPAADMLLINPPNSTPLFSIGAATEPSDKVEIAADSPITDFIDLDEMSLLESRQIDAIWAETLIRAGDSDLLLSGELDARQIAIMPFDLRDSNLPLLIAFPVLMANLLEWFSPADVVALPDAPRPGDPLLIKPPLHADSIRITAPDGATQELRADARHLLYSGADQLGLYLLEVIEAGEVKTRQRFAINLFVTDESEIQPRAEAELSLGGTARPADADARLGLREYWSLAVLLALLLLLIEWVVYHRRMRAPTLLRPNPQSRGFMPRFARNS